LFRWTTFRVALAAAVPALAIAFWPLPGPPKAVNLNILLISLDTLRADRLGLYGNPNATSPALDRFASGAAVFEQAVAESSWTLPSHMTMLTGLHPLSHGVNDQDHELRRTSRFLAEMLRERGYRTFAMTGGGYVEKRRFERGFDVFRTSRAPFAAVLRAAETWILGVPPGKPWFAFLHTYDIHCPYDPPEPYRSMFVPPGPEPLSPPMHGSQEMGLCRKYKQLDPDQVRYVSGVYDGDIRWVDDALASFFEFLEREKLRESTVVVITSDHGEELFEHGGGDHGTTLFREQLIVPLLVAAPDAYARRIGGLVGLADIVPTALELAGQSVPAGLDGRSLASVIRSWHGDAPSDARVSTLVKTRPEKSYRMSSWLDDEDHLIDDRQEGVVMLFDAAKDRAEANDRAAKEKDAAATIRGRLLDYERGFAGKPGAPASSTSPSAEELERLKSLGYLDQ
jgi:arylsulfatase A-like enzyme